MSNFRVRAIKAVSPELLAFLEDFKSGTEGYGRNRMWQDSVVFDVGIFDGNVDLDYIVSVKEKNAGNATKAMRWLCALADKHSVSIKLEVKSIRKAGAEGKSLNNAELRKFYSRFGFKKYRVDEMMRPPNKGV